VAEVHLFAAARAAVGAPQVMVEAGTLGAVLDALSAAHPAFVPVRARCSFLVDGLAAIDPAIPIGPEQRVDVLPPFAGG
jgi:molybdopterin converting factor small subunit